MSDKPSYEQLETRVRELEHLVYSRQIVDEMALKDRSLTSILEDGPIETKQNLETLELSDIIDFNAIQAMMDDFYALTHIGVAIVDLKGRILVATGWQDICTKFHRVHPQSKDNCLESDTILSKGVEPGKFKIYRCKNNMWDMVTPITVGGEHMGNLFLGQFLFDNETPDLDVFRSQAKQFDFEEKKYLSALDRVPRWSHATVDTVMSFYSKSAHLISKLSYGNVRLSQTLEQRDRLIGSLQESEQRYRHLFETINDAVFVHLIDDNGLPGRFIQVNDIACQRLGYTRQELLQLTPRDIGGGDTVGVDKIRKTLMTDDSALFETVHVTKDGRRLPVESNVRMLNINGQKAALSISRDISDRKASEEKLRDSISELTAIQHHAPIAMMIVDQDRRVRKVNGAAASFTDRTPEEVIGLRGGEALRCIHHLDDPQGCGFGPSCATCAIRIAVMDTFATGNSHQNVESWMRFSKDGEVVEKCFLVSTARLQIADEQRVLVCAQDITERKRYEEALKESEARFRNLYDQSPSPYQALDENGRYIEVNKAWLVELGYERHEVIGKPFSYFLAGNGPDLFHLRFPIFKERGRTHGVEFEMIRKNGATCIMSFEGRICRDQNGKFLQTHCVLTNITEKKRVEDDLKRNLSLLEATLESTADGILVADGEGKMVRFNKKFAQMWGIPDHILISVDENAALNHVLSQLVEPEEFIEIVRNLYANPCESSFDTIAFKDGRVFERYSQPQRIGDSIIGRVWSFRDITERKRSEEALRESEALLNEAQAIAGVGSFFWDIGNDTLKWSRHMFTIAGLDPDAFYGNLQDTIANMIYPDDRDSVKEQIDQMISQRKTFPMEFRLVRPDGNIRWLRSRSRFEFDHHGLPVRCIGVHHDITEQKAAAQALKESQEKYRMVVENAAEAIFVAQDGYITFCNPKTEEIIGFPSTELYARPLSEFIHPDDRQLVMDRHFRRMKGESLPSNYTFKVVAAKGQVKCVEINVISIEWERKPATLSFLTDVTEWENAEQQRLKLERQVQHSQRIQAIGTLAGGIAHDFNNVLFPIMGLSEILLEDLESGSASHSHVQSIFQSAKRAKELVKQILAFSRQADQDTKPIRLQNIVKEVAALIRSTLPTTIEIRHRIDPTCGLVMADPVQIHQVLMNLVTNAYHAMEENGGLLEIGLDNKYLDAADLNDSTMKAGTYVCLSVIDTGNGMDEETKAKIFDPYFTTKPVGKGTGLGLSVVHGIVKSHGGEISVYSEPTKGTVIKVYLPLMEPLSELEPKQESLTTPGGHEHILLVDDEQAIVSMEKALLQRLGYVVTGRTSSLEALEAFKANPLRFDLVITDMTMPHMTGTQLAQKIKELRPETKVIVCTGFSEHIDSEKAGQFNIDGFIMKPMLKNEIAIKIRQILNEITP